jgi:hypothetical protein
LAKRLLSKAANTATMAAISAGLGYMAEKARDAVLEAMRKLEPSDSTSKESDEARSA